MNYQRLVLVGNATNDPERKTSKKGDVAYTTFQVAVRDARDRTTYFPVAVFGQQAEIVARHVSKGRQVLVEGRIEVAENGRFNVVADHVVFGAAAIRSDEGEQ
jgi:single-strand DNA-binding protein